ncbi:hypothetical protein [Streptomyces bacillaris]|uniref:hypothetical protein n=1 Tax=Streptomyces bacillaris TaxID=68179 RepID=UPI00365711DC
MTGPEHYREAEAHLATAAQNFLAGDDTSSALAAAQVHATLALAAATAPNDAQPDFYKPGHTYADPDPALHDWQFRCDTVTTHPEDGERTALGWRHFKGRWEPIAYGEDDYDLHGFVGTTDQPEAPRG